MNMLFKLRVQYMSQQAATHTQGWNVPVQTFLNSHTVPQLSADVLKRMRESERLNNTESPSSAQDNPKDPSSKHLLWQGNPCGPALVCS